MKFRKHILPLLLLPLLTVMVLCSCRMRESAAENSIGVGRVPMKEETTEVPLSSLPEPAETARQPTEEELREEAIDRLISGMTLEEKLGQMFLAAYSGDSTAEILNRYHFGGFILFAKDFESETPDSIAADLAALQESAEYGLILAVDEEGGTVTRISKFTQYRTEPFRSPRDLYNSGGIDAIRTDTAEKAELLSSLGINVNMAPVCDISTDTEDFMYARSLGENAELTAEFVSLVVKESQNRGIGSALKHFPGYGKAVDTHTGMAYDTRSYEEIAAWDLLPFQAGIDSGAGFVMLSHIISSAIDPDRPASVSPKAADILRNTMGFDGVIITDDLAMEGITEFSESGYAALDAISAGCDMVCCSNWAEQYPAVLAACQNGTIPESRLDESVKRILCLKLTLGILTME